jgi:CRISPR-associated protein Csd1
MSLWQHLAESYDNNVNALKASYPLSATSISNNTEWIAVIVIDGNGNFIEVRKIEKAKKDTKTKQDIIPTVSLNIPVTEKSAGRTSTTISPHPVFDQYEYLKGSGDKFGPYTTQLAAFANSEFVTPQVKAIHAYIDKGSVEIDLSALQPKAKTNIVFEVQIPPGNPQAKVWEDSTFFERWHEYYLSTKERQIDEKRKTSEGLTKKEKLSKDEKQKLKALEENHEELSLDLITGKPQLLAISHPKKISSTSTSANAKLISDNDSTNFTFRGRFENASQAISIGYESSQRAHQFLRYLVNDRGVVCDEQVILSFTIGSMENTLPPPLNDTKSIYDFLEENAGPQTEADVQIALHAKTGFDYADALKRALAGFRYGKLMEQHAKTAVLALDAPIPGRMSITFYRELARKGYLEKIAEWHKDCKWNFCREEGGKKISAPFIGAPSVDRIIEAVFGRPRSSNDKSYTKVKKTARERLLRCIFDGAFLPADYVISAVRRASNPLVVTRNGKFDRNDFDPILSTACALVRKDFKQRKMEDYDLSLELERTDRSYLYGRLLGAADKLEEHALYKNEKYRVVTAAIRYMQTFSQRPFRTWETIHDCLLPYIQKVKGDFAFREIEVVKNLFQGRDFENDTPLDGSYLLGYYCERAYIDKLATEAKVKKEAKTKEQSALGNLSSINESENNHVPEEQN